MTDSANIRIIRGKRDRENHYFVCSREPAQNRNLSWEARGLLWYLLSKPDNWVIRVKDLMQNCGRDRVYKLLNELIEHRYIVREKVRGKNQTYSEFTYKVFEQPQPVPENTEVAHGEKPLPDSPYTANTDTKYLESSKYLEKKTKIAAPENGADAASSEPKPKCEQKQQPEPDKIFNAVAKHIFGITSSEELKNIGGGGRISLIVCWLKKGQGGVTYKREVKKFGEITKPASAADIQKFSEDWDEEHDGIEKPQAFEKFVIAWRRWASSQSDGETDEVKEYRKQQAAIQEAEAKEWEQLEGK